MSCVRRAVLSSEHSTPSACDMGMCGSAIDGDVCVHRLKFKKYCLEGANASMDVG